MKLKRHFDEMFVPANLIEMVFFPFHCSSSLMITGGFSSQRASNVACVPMSWRHHIDGLVQDCSISIANALEILEVIIYSFTPALITSIIR